MAACDRASADGTRSPRPSENRITVFELIEKQYARRRELVNKSYARAPSDPDTGQLSLFL